MAVTFHAAQQVLSWPDDGEWPWLAVESAAAAFCSSAVPEHGSGFGWLVALDRGQARSRMVAIIARKVDDGGDKH